MTEDPPDLAEGVSGGVPVRESADPHLASAWSLVLEAMGIPHGITFGPEDRWAIVVEPARVSAAQAQLAAWEAENAPRPAAPPPPRYGASSAGVTAGLALLACHAFTMGPGAGWVAAGRADAALIAGGAWWRAVTALTLHADVAHVAGNAVALALLLSAVSARLGPALACWLALLTGVVGNLVTALLAGSGHVAVGASTGVFGLLGATTALGAAGRQGWVALAAGLALLGLLGAGEHADVLAHLLGFAAGLVAGAALRRARPPRRSMLQPLLATAAAGPVALAWWRALHP